MKITRLHVPTIKQSHKTPLALHASYHESLISYIIMLRRHLRTAVRDKRIFLHSNPLKQCCCFCMIFSTKKLGFPNRARIDQHGLNRRKKFLKSQRGMVVSPTKMGNHLPLNGIPTDSSNLASTKTHELSVSADSNTAGGFENGTPEAKWKVEA